jgi:hypothetical protein
VDTLPRVPEAHLRKIRSFVRRPGRATVAQRRALTDLLPRFGVDQAAGRLDLPTLFGRDAPRVLDIGFGDGDALATSAANFPALDYLGVEVHEPGVGHVLLLLEQAALTNVRVIVRDAAEVLPQLLPDASFAAVNLFFRILGRRSATTNAGSYSRRSLRSLGVCSSAAACCISPPTGPITHGTRARSWNSFRVSRPMPAPISRAIRSHSARRRSSSGAAVGWGTKSRTFIIV